MTSIDRHQLAAIGAVGSFFDVLGALYLAYDVLGGAHGPLRMLTRAVTYGVLFGVGFGLPLGLTFGIATGLTHGVTIALETGRISHEKGRYSLGYEALFSLIRGVGYAIGTASMHGPKFGAAFGVLAAGGQIAAYRAGVWPGMDYEPRRTPRITRRQVAAAVLRAFGFGAAGYLSAAFAGHQMHAISFGTDVGLTIGIVTALANFLMPYVEWFSGNLPDRRLGVFGVVLILMGFGVQSVQYWVALLDVAIR